LHPGIAYLHGHKPFYVNVAYDSIPGNIVYLGDALPQINTVGDMIDRLDRLMHVSVAEQMLEAEKKIRDCCDIAETSLAARCRISPASGKNQKRVIHMFPHTGFTAKHLETLVKENPDVDTLIASISRVYPGHALITKAQELGLNFVCGNSHALEIFENGLPLAYALKPHLPEAEIVIFRERVASTPLSNSVLLKTKSPQTMANTILNKS
jgi:hypothetical protein